jgi:hypothetical protein
VNLTWQGGFTPEDDKVEMYYGLNPDEPGRPGIHSPCIFFSLKSCSRWRKRAVIVGISDVWKLNFLDNCRSSDSRILECDEISWSA